MLHFAISRIGKPSGGRPRCFVAMAFARNDTEKLYDRLIEPTLDKLGVTPVRVDRVEYLGDIDDRIISELLRCDFVLADLTYARPSVYFEAGFAERTVPVIYSCRRDHFSPKANDAFGNLSVHFDLQMKNIIDWSDPFDARFAQRLSMRVKKVIQPLLRMKALHKREKGEAEKFKSMSIRDRSSRVLSLCLSGLKRAGYNLYGAGDSQLVAAKTQRDHFIGIAVHVLPNLLKRELSQIIEAYRDAIGGMAGTHRKSRHIKKLVMHLFLCCLRRVPRARLMSYVPYFEFVQASNAFRGPGLTSFKNQMVVFPFFIHMLDAIESEKIARLSFSEKLRDLDCTTRDASGVGTFLPRHQQIQNRQQRGTT